MSRLIPHRTEYVEFGAKALTRNIHIHRLVQNIASSSYVVLDMAGDSRDVTSTAWDVVPTVLDLASAIRHPGRPWRASMHRQRLMRCAAQLAHS